MLSDQLSLLVATAGAAGDPPWYVAAGPWILMFGILRGQSYIKMIMDHTVPMSDEGWMIITKRLAMFFAVLAVLNEVVWRTMSTDMWVNFKTFGLPLAIFVFFMTQSGVFQKYGTDEDKADA